MTARNVIEMAGSFGRATGSAVLDDQDSVLAVFDSVHSREFRKEAALSISAPGMHA